MWCASALGKSNRQADRVTHNGGWLGRSAADRPSQPSVVAATSMATSPASGLAASTPSLVYSLGGVLNSADATLSHLMHGSLTADRVSREWQAGPTANNSSASTTTHPNLSWIRHEMSTGTDTPADTQTRGGQLCRETAANYVVKSHTVPGTSVMSQDNGLV